MGDQGKRIEARNCTGRSKLKVWSKTRSQASDDWLYSYIESDFTHNYVASQKINVKRIRSHCLVAIFFFFATSICIQDMHFHPTARKLYLNKLTLTVCLRNARTTYFIFRNDYLQPLQEGLKEEKEKKNPKQPEEKAIPSGHDVKITSYWHQCDVFTSHWRQYDVILTSYTCWNVIKKSQSPTAHDVLLTSMRRDLRRIDVDTTSFCHSNCLPCLSK